MVLKSNPQLPGIHYRLGRLLLSKPATPTVKEEARKEFEEELRINPSNAGAEFVLGELARQAENYPEAIERFTRATKMDAMFADAFIGLGRSLLDAQKGAEAVPPLERAEKLQPDNPTVHFLLANAYRRSGRQADADREVLWMRYYDSLSFKEVAEILRITEGAATLRHVRALRRLKRSRLSAANCAN